LNKGRDGQIRTDDPLLPKDIGASQQVIGERARRQAQADSGCHVTPGRSHLRELERLRCALGNGGGWS